MWAADAFDAEFGGRIRTRYSTGLELKGVVKRADVVIVAVLVPGHKAPKLVTNSLVAQMKPGAARRLYRPGRLLRGFPAHDP